MSRARALGAVVVVAAVATGVHHTAAAGSWPGRPHADHVLLISVDGLHQRDLRWFVAANPGSALARLVAGGVEFTNARTPAISDSFPGLIAQLSGGNPQTTGIYYDDTWNRELFPAGTTDCAGATAGAEVNYSEALDLDPHALDAGQGLGGLPASILSMTDAPQALIDPAKLPVDPVTCTPVLPHSYLRVNTIFEVAHAAGLRTAWADKHPAYEIADGPSGQGVDDLFTPEINSDAPTEGSSNDWTKVNSLTQQYDDVKVQAVLNEIAGLDHGGTRNVGTPAIFGLNFQSVSTAQKLPASDGLTGGYEPDGLTPGPLLRSALGFVDRELGRMQQAIHRTNLDDDTVVVLSAKHGQSPTEPAALTRIDDGALLDGLDAAWAQTHPGAAPLVSFSVDDDAMLLWLSDRSLAARSFARDYLLAQRGTGTDINASPKPFTRSGLRFVFTGRSVALFLAAGGGPLVDTTRDPRAPDLIGVVQDGVVYTGGTKKIAEHGGSDPQDRDVPLVVSGTIVRPGIERRPVETTQIAPTILRMLGLDPGSLEAVRIEHTRELPVR